MWNRDAGGLDPILLKTELRVITCTPSGPPSGYSSKSALDQSDCSIPVSIPLNMGICCCAKVELKCRIFFGDYRKTFENVKLPGYRINKAGFFKNVQPRPRRLDPCNPTNVSTPPDDEGQPWKYPNFAPIPSSYFRPVTTVLGSPKIENLVPSKNVHLKIFANHHFTLFRRFVRVLDPDGGDEGSGVQISRRGQGWKIRKFRKNTKMDA